MFKAFGVLLVAISILVIIFTAMTGGYTEKEWIKILCGSICCVCAVSFTIGLAFIAGMTV